MIKFIITFLISSTLFNIVAPSHVMAVQTGNNDEMVIVDEKVEIAKEEYFLSVIKENNTISTEITNDDGVVKVIQNLSTNLVAITSDFLNEEEVRNMENEINGLVPTPFDNLFKHRDLISDDMVVSPFAQTGNWMWSSWNNKSITANGKAATQTIISAIGSAFGIYGAAAAGFANLYIIYNIETGYFRNRYGTRLDTDHRYVWRRSEVRMYKESSRTTLLRTTLTSPYREWMGI